MKALVYTGTQMSEIRDVDMPIAGDNQVLVDLTFCGICGSDMHAWHGHDERRVPPLVLGHEAVGIVQTGALAGKRVAINPLMTCGDCDCCNRGDEHLCPSRELIGMRVPGAFAEKLAIDSGNLTVIDDDLPFAEAALAEPLACSVHAVRLARQLAGDHRDAAIVVLGGGRLVFWPRWCLRLMVMAISRLPKPMHFAAKCWKRSESCAPMIRFAKRLIPAGLILSLMQSDQGRRVVRQARLCGQAGLLFISDCRIMNLALIRAASPCRKLNFKAPIAIAKMILPKPWPC